MHNHHDQENNIYLLVLFGRLHKETSSFPVKKMLVLLRLVRNNFYLLGKKHLTKQKIIPTHNIWPMQCKITPMSFSKCNILMQSVVKVSPNIGVWERLGWPAYHLTNIAPKLPDYLVAASPVLNCLASEHNLLKVTSEHNFLNITRVCPKIIIKQ